jgi:hypothetical protein
LLNTDLNKLKKSNGQLYPQVKALEAGEFCIRFVTLTVAAELAKNKTPEKDADLKKLQDRSVICYRTACCGDIVHASIAANNASAKAVRYV